MLNAAPNPAHIALARLALPAVRTKLAPNSESFTLLTQNIDGLDRRAIDQVYSTEGLPSPFAEQTGAEPILIELHGHTAGIRCTNYECKYRGMNFDLPLCPALEGIDMPAERTEAESPSPQDVRPKRTAAEARAWAEARLAGTPSTDPAQEDGERVIPVSELPRCPKCGALLRPDVVWFTEVPHRAEEAVQIVEKADLCLVVGTSAVVRVVHPVRSANERCSPHVRACGHHKGYEEILSAHYRCRSIRRYLLEIIVLS